MWWVTSEIKVLIIFCIFQVLCLAALVAVALASDGHGQAYSFQHINRHDGKPEVVHIGHGHGHGDQHGHDHVVDYHVNILHIKTVAF